MTRILVVHFSQTGQLNAVVNAFVQPLLSKANIEVVFEELRPQQAFAFPWKFTEFFNTFPETVAMQPIPLQPLQLHEQELASFDLIILAYQVWFLTPSLPVSSFLQSHEAAVIFKNKPVITLIACRNMWLQAQELVKVQLNRLQARLIDNVVLIDAAGTALSFISTPLWMLTGKKGPVGFLPKAGVSERDIASASRFGEAILKHLQSDQPELTSPLLQGLAAVKVNERLIPSEVMARRGFVLWGKLIRACGKKDNPLRKILVYFYVVYLITLILTFVPITAVLKRLLAPLMRKRIAQQKAYFALPSGSDDYKLRKGCENG
jgi:hypothetical protein